MSYFSKVAIRDGANLDAFSRVRVSQPASLFESTMLYDLSPLQYEQITSSGTIAYDATNSAADFSISSATGLAAMQSFRWIRYQPGKSQLVILTGLFGAAAANVTRRLGLFNATNSGATVTIGNGIFLEQTGASTVNLRIVNSGTVADQTVAQASWNIDPLTGSGVSGKTLNLETTCILVIDLQWLGMGRVRVGFDIDGEICYAHEFLNANVYTDVYMKTASLPIRAELTTSASASATMSFVCATVISEGGADTTQGYQFATEWSGTAGSGSRVHLGSLRPYTTFNSQAVRYPINITNIHTLVTGVNPVLFEAVYGATFSAGPTWAGAAFSTYSGVEVTTAAGTINTSPIVARAWYTAGGASVKDSTSRGFDALYPLTLDAAGAQRALGTVSFYATGIGGTSACRLALEWDEMR